MRLFVYLLEGRGWAAKDSYVKLQVGKYKSKSRLLKNTENPLWNEEFVFRVHDLEDELVVSVYKYDDHEHGFFNVSAGEFVGRVKIPVWSVAAEENQNLPPTWFSVERPKNAKSIDKDCGKLLLALSLHGREYTSTESNNSLQSEGKYTSSRDAHVPDAPSKKTLEGKHLMKALAGRLEKLLNKKDETSRNDSSSELSTPSDYEDCGVEPPSSSSFEESIELFQSKNENREMPENLQGGILLDQTYEVSPKDLNMVLFAPNSEFKRNLAELRGTTDIQENPWKWESEGVSCLRRVVTYTKAATKLVKAVKATKSKPISRPMVMDLLYLLIQNTMMKGMIESGARQGLKENFDQFSSLLSQKFKVIKAADVSDKDHMLATLETEHQSDSKLAVQYFWNFTVFWRTYHLWHFGSSVERVYYMISHFVEARLRRGSDHGVKAQGDGWVLTVALIEGANLASINSTEIPDPYVVFTCNGKTRTSSVKLQTLDPQWNGPFDQASSLGHAEINFLKHTAAELADLWVPLGGKLAQSSQSKLHLRIFLDNNNGVETIRDYLASLEKEEFNLPKNFGLPPEEFLISDFSCSLKKKDAVTGRGLDSRHGAKILDEHGRLHFCFHSFVSFNDASRTIMALWRTRTLEPDQKAEIAEDQLDDDDKPFLLEDTGSYLVVEDAKMTKVYTVELPVNLKSLMKMFNGGELEHKVMSKSGCLNYVTTTWEHVTSDVQERRVSYKFSRRSQSLEEKLPAHSKNLPYRITVQFRYQIEKSSFTHNCCKCDIYIGVMWLRSNKFESRITRNIIGKFTNRLEEILQLVEREILLASQ
ncbi:hypothetical protein DH2020_042691 [Rehmannia glutinosa]|uniref:C2 and GRAM domain-containing protein n=1 Tax=Rehmannia glutinosa TaxID=99300 RepID=A0ABR0UNR5_REHGL